MSTFYFIELILSITFSPIHASVSILTYCAVFKKLPLLKILLLEVEVETNVSIKSNSSGFVFKLTGKITKLSVVIIYWMLYI